MVLKMNVWLYGMGPAMLEYQKRFDKTKERAGMHTSKYDPCLSHKYTPKYNRDGSPTMVPKKNADGETQLQTAIGSDGKPKLDADGQEQQEPIRLKSLRESILL